jgi:hypothetical protein|uniref:Uncharacterized protein n=1 Tax=viral metagenome TaxID=1070528 RepID=A0A6C0LXU7_9ZZZZ
MRYSRIVEGIREKRKLRQLQMNMTTFKKNTPPPPEPEVEVKEEVEEYVLIPGDCSENMTIIVTEK